MHGRVGGVGPARARTASRQLRGAAVLALAGVLGGCGGGGGGGGAAVAGPDAPVLTRLSVTLSPSTAPVGRPVAATAEGLDQRGLPIAAGPVTWRSETPTVAQVDASGAITTVAPGQVTIVATAGRVEGRATLAVLEVPAARIVVSPEVATLAAGTERTLQATVLDASGRTLPGRGVAWSSSAPAVASVSADGTVRALAVGSATIVATAGPVSGRATVTVPGPADAAATLAIAAPATRLAVGDSTQLTALVRNAAGEALEGRAVEWVATVVAGSGVLSVSPTGLVRATSTGTAIVEALADGQRAAVTIVVPENLGEGMTVGFASPEPNELIGDTLRVYVSVRSPRPLARVSATVEGITVVLQSTPVGFSGLGEAWVGELHLRDLRFGPYILTALARDVTGAVAIASIPFRRDTRTGEGGTTAVPPKSK